MDKVLAVQELRAGVWNADPMSKDQQARLPEIPILGRQRQGIAGAIWLARLGRISMFWIQGEIDERRCLSSTFACIHLQNLKVVS